MIERLRFRFRTKRGLVRDAITSLGTVELGGRMFAVTSIADLGGTDLAALVPDPMRNLFENNTEAIVMFSLHFQVREANAAARGLLGYTLEALRELDFEALQTEAGNKIRSATGRLLSMEDRGMTIDASGVPVRVVTLRRIPMVN